MQFEINYLYIYDMETALSLVRDGMNVNVWQVSLGGAYNIDWLEVINIMFQITKFIYINSTINTELKSKSI